MGLSPIPDDRIRPKMACQPIFYKGQKIYKFPYGAMLGMNIVQDGTRAHLKDRNKFNDDIHISHLEVIYRNAMERIFLNYLHECKGRSGPDDLLFHKYFRDDT